MHVMPCIHISNGINLKWSQFIYVNRSKSNSIETVSNFEKDAIFLRINTHIICLVQQESQSHARGKENKISVHMIKKSCSPFCIPNIFPPHHFVYLMSHAWIIGNGFCWFIEKIYYNIFRISNTPVAC